MSISNFPSLPLTCNLILKYSFFIACYLLFAICYFTYPSPTHASGEFSTSFHSDYQINARGLTTVNHDINITNLLSHLYTTEYTILISSPNLTSIQAKQDGETIEFVSTTTEISTSITLKNLIPVIGQGQVTTLSISYDTSDIAEILGRTWSINIPRLTRANEASEFIRTVRVPTSLGTPSAQYPEATSIQRDKELGQTILTYKGHPNKSLTILFGDSEYYQLDLTYQINNPTVVSADTEIALPPDTPYQHVILDSITPPPTQVNTDPDGNWLARYPLRPSESLTVHATLFIETYALPQYSSVLENKKPLTKHLPFWDSNNSAIIELADQLNTPENIYNYLISNLSYDYARLANNPTRLGSLEALSKPSFALCTEYTDLFIALTRSLNIPAREINGYAYTTSSTLRPLGVATADILHAWPEYYDREHSTWTQIDPTWGHTTGGVDYFHKLDFNHITFVTHGLESEYPIPAGAYKSDPSLSTIQVKLVGELPELINNLEESTVQNETTIHNYGNMSIQHNDYGYLPPYGSLVIHTSPLASNTLIPNLYPWILLAVIIIIVFFFVHKHRNKHSF